jgi:hydrogenase large subunit
LGNEAKASAPKTRILSAEWIINLGKAAEYMFDHNIFQDNLVGVDFCEMMVKETNPGA